MFHLWLSKHNILITVPPRCGSRHFSALYNKNYCKSVPKELLDDLSDIDSKTIAKLTKSSQNWLVVREHHDRLASNFYNKMVDITGESWRDKTPFQKMYHRVNDFASFIEKVCYELKVHRKFQSEGADYPLDPHIAPFAVLMNGEIPVKTFSFNNPILVYRAIENILGLSPVPESFFTIKKDKKCNRYLSSEATLQFLEGNYIRTNDADAKPYGPSPWPLSSLESVHQDKLFLYYEEFGNYFPQTWSLWSKDSWDRASEEYLKYDGEIVPASIEKKCSNLIADKYPPLKSIGVHSHTLAGPAGEILNYDWSNNKAPQDKTYLFSLASPSAKKEEND